LNALTFKCINSTDLLADAPEPEESFRVGQ